jgi:sugar phosphate permease
VTEPTHQKRRLFYGYWVVAGSFALLFLFAGAGFYSFSIFIMPLEDEFGWSRSAVMLAMSIYMILHGVTGPFVGHWTETYGPRRVMTIFALLSGVAFVLVSFTFSLWYFYLAYAVLSIATTGIGFIPISSVLARWFVRNRGTAIGFSMVGIATGGLVMAPLVGAIIPRFGWRGAFVFMGALVWVVALPVTLLVMKGNPAEMGLLPDGDLPDAERASDAQATWTDAGGTEPAEKGWPLGAAMRSGTFFWLAATFFIGPLAQMGMLQHQAPLTVEAGFPRELASTAVGLTAGLGGLGKLFFGWVSDKIPIRNTVMLCFGLQAVSVLVLLNAGSMATVWVYVALFGFSMGGMIVLLPLMVSHFFGLTNFGAIMGMVSLVLALGNAVGAVLSGVIYDSLGSYHYAMITYICLYATAAFCIALAGRPREYREVL